MGDVLNSVTPQDPLYRDELDSQHKHMVKDLEKFGPI